MYILIFARSASVRYFILLEFNAIFVREGRIRSTICLTRWRDLINFVREIFKLNLQYITFRPVSLSKNQRLTSDLSNGNATMYVEIIITHDYCDIVIACYIKRNRSISVSRYCVSGS